MKLLAQDWNCVTPTNTVNGCYRINLGYYPVLSKLAGYKCEQWRLLVDFLYKKLLILAKIAMLFKNFVEVWFF